MSKLKLNIVIVGAGNVAWHLAKELQKKEQKIIQVYNRSIEPAISLSQHLNCDFTSRIEDINENADLYILTVKDSVIEEVSKLIKIKNKLIVHTSGAVEQNIIKHKRRGVFYPLQTFSKEIPSFRVNLFGESSLCKFFIIFHTWLLKTLNLNTTP